ncbi:hypothetical protein Vi05172_g12530 [Venturia inaequalis]|uniref:Integral membrane bound transporter domain-containing protein n=1 Tax=Venturia inaequalis TaxID=5025 RepID=A0A8H3YYE6_VENIN|nr:hypothetical protein EG327_009084 [Venturia inaequalis]RDI77482.1 hypothetical protein Vi05172_g12530 [Venturia inaequalis]
MNSSGDNTFDDAFSQHNKFPARKTQRSTLRAATLVDPQSGERVKRSFTLRYTNSSHNNATARTPLLPRSRATNGSRSSALWATMKEQLWVWYAYWTSIKGIGILKCSIAYVLASLATFTPAISKMLGKGDGKHMVATVVTYFHPARSFGSMLEALIWALIAVAYAAAVCFSSMGVVRLFASHNLLKVGHAVVLTVFCGGSLGFVGWWKLKRGNALVNVACSLTSLVIITIITKEEALLEGNFSVEKIWQVLKIVVMAVAMTMGVSLCIKPTFARNGLRQDFINITDLLEEILTTTTRSFLAGSEQDLQEASFKQASTTYKAVFNTLLKDLGEARYEHYLLGTEKEFHVEAKLVKTIERLSQSITGLRSAAETQFSLLASISHGAATPVGILRMDSISSSPLQSPDFSNIDERMKQLGAITEEPEEDADTTPSSPEEQFTMSRLSSFVATAAGPSEIFSLFIKELGPSMKSLAWTLKHILLELPFESGPQHQITINSNFRRSLLDAMDLYSDARKEALGKLYNSRSLAKTRTSEVSADFEEVAASCGHFSSSLFDFAEDTVAYLDILEELQEVIGSRRRSWHWLRFWWSGGKRPSSTRSNSSEEEQQLLRESNPARRMSVVVPTPRVNPISKTRSAAKDVGRKYYPYLWRSFGFLRREDIRFAIKVGLGAVLWAMFSFIPNTRKFYFRWRGEWGLLSYMLVCSMTIGASNTTGTQRFFGTVLGALFAVVAWIAAQENPWILGAFGWAVSVGCFYIIVGRGMGPMGRFILLTYNLSALYAYSLSAKDDDDDDDEGGISPEIWEIVIHRMASVLAGCLWGMIVTRFIYPISARKKLKHGTAVLWLRMGLIWKRDPLTILTDVESRSTYMDIRESLELQRFLQHLDGLRESAAHEFEMRGPFRNLESKNILAATGRMLGAFHAMNVVISKDLKASPGEQELLRFTKEERKELSARISHLFSVLASSIKLEYPITDAVPKIVHTRDRFLAKLHDFRRHAPGRELATDEDFELLYAYALVTGQIANEIESICTQLEHLYGVLDEETLKFR